MARTALTFSVLLVLCTIHSAGQTITAVTNGASFAPSELAPGSIATIFGTNLSASTAQATAASLPTFLGGVTVSIRGVGVPLYYVSPTQINFQVPGNVLGGLPTNASGVGVFGHGVNLQFPFAASASAPGIFAGSNGWAIAQNQDYSLNAADNPAAPGSYITVYLTGIGDVDNPVADGAPTPDSPLSRAIAPVTASIGGVTATVVFAGLTPGFVGLAQANIEIPNMPPGAYPLRITVGAAVSNSATIAVSGGTASPQYLFQSVMGDGVTGSPATATSSHAAGTALPYSYAPMSGFSGTVEIDGTVSPLSGNVVANADHWLWAYGQPTTGTDFPGYITAPNDPSVIPYPQFYGHRPSSQTVRVVDPYCGIQSNVIAYPHSFLGSFPMPAVTGAPLPHSISRGVQLKDYWFNSSAPFQVAMNSNCPLDANGMRLAFADSVARATKLGADHVSVVDTPVVVDLTAQPVVLNPTVWGVGIPESDLAFIASTTAAAGLDLWLDIQVGVDGLPKPTQQQFSSFLDAYSQYIVQEAQRAQKYGVKSMMLNWNAWFVDVTPFGDLYPMKMMAALSQVRKVFTGKVRLSDIGVGIQDPSSGLFAALYKSVDAIQVGNGVPLSADEDRNLSFALVKQKFKYMFGQMAERFAAFPALNFSLLSLIQSHRYFLDTGWIEDSFCVNGCVQKALQTDFSVQAIGYEAVLEATVESGLNFVSFDPGGYWFVDVILPRDSFPNTGQTIRNKPAEAIVQRWFAK